MSLLFEFKSSLGGNVASNQQKACRQKFPQLQRDSVLKYLYSSQVFDVDTQLESNGCSWREQSVKTECKSGIQGIIPVLFKGNGSQNSH